MQAAETLMRLAGDEVFMSWSPHPINSPPEIAARLQAIEKALRFPD